MNHAEALLALFAEKLEDAGCAEEKLILEVNFCVGEGKVLCGAFEVGCRFHPSACGRAGNELGSKGYGCAIAAGFPDDEMPESRIHKSDKRCAMDYTIRIAVTRISLEAIAELTVRHFASVVGSVVTDIAVIFGKGLIPGRWFECHSVFVPVPKVKVVGVMTKL